MPPYFLTKIESHLQIGSQLLLGSPDLYTATVAHLGISEVERQCVYFALNISSIPIVANVTSSVAEDPTTSLRESLQKQVGIIDILAKWKNAAFALRYFYKPEEQRINIYLVCKGAFPLNTPDYLKVEFAGDIRRALTTAGYFIEPVRGLNELEEVVDLPVGVNSIVEIRQREEIVQMVEGSAYIVYPMSFALTNWHHLFKTIVEQNDWAILNIHLQPTNLFDTERQELEIAVQIAATLQEYKLDRFTREGTVVDPVATLVLDKYLEFLKRLKSPVLCVAQVLSSNPISANTIANALVSESRATADIVQSNNSLQIILPSRDQIDAALSTYLNVSLHCWNGELASIGKERLQYLTDYRGAATLFRFPIGTAAGIPGVITHEEIPIHFPSGKRPLSQNAVELGRIANTQIIYSLPTDKLNAHCLIVGTNRHGKTTTAMQMLTQLWNRFEIPFLVIEPARKEYRTLLSSSLGEALQIFTLGDEDVSPLRLNPFEILAGTKVETHIRRISTCLLATMPLYAMLPNLVLETLQVMYVRLGWQLSEKVTDNNTRGFPTLADFYFEFISEVQRRPWTAEVRANLLGAGEGRIKPLLNGSTGRLFNTYRSFPFKELLHRPTVIELNDLGHDQQALTTLFILNYLRAYCENERVSDKLKHITLIEEAHRIASRTSTVNREIEANTSSQASDFVAELLKEIGGYGEAIILADQVPTQLAYDALVNTNTKIVHTLPGGEDRDYVGGALRATQAQIDVIASMPAGRACVFVTGQTNVDFVDITNLRQDQNLAGSVRDDAVAQWMAPIQAKMPKLPFKGCSYCVKQCEYRDRVGTVAYRFESHDRFAKSLEALHLGRQSLDELVKQCLEFLRPVNQHQDVHAAFCFFIHMIRARDLPSRQMRDLAKAFMSHSS